MVKFVPNRIQEYFTNWRNKTPKQKWEHIYSLGGLLAELIGITVYNNMEVYWFSYFSDVMGFLYLSPAFYTVWFYFDQGGYLRGLQAFCAVGVVTTCLIVQIQMITSTRFIMNNLLSSGKYIYMEGENTAKYKAIRVKLIEELIRDIIVVMTVILLGYAIFGIPPLYMLIVKRERTTLFGLELPFFERGSDIGFFVNLTMEAVISGLGLIGTLSIEIGQSLVHHVISSMPHLIHIDIEEVVEEVKMNGMTLKAKVQLRDIFLKVQDFGSFARKTRDIYYMRCFVGPYLYTYSIGFSILGQYFLGYPTGYGCAACNYVLLLICCHLGEKMEASKKHIITELFDMPWFLLPASSQRGVLCAIHKIQNAKSLTIGPFSILNMETAADLTKSIYRFCMLLYRVFN